MELKAGNEQKKTMKPQAVSLKRLIKSITSSEASKKRENKQTLILNEKGVTTIDPMDIKRISHLSHGYKEIL